ncbi:MAG: zinc-binding dehydrogenase [Sumerlaeia bacterium]
MSEQGQSTAVAVPPRTMRTAVLEAPRRVRTEQVAVPEPGPGEVLVRLEGCGICGSNREPWEGRDWFDYPFEPGAPGHEGWGRVAAVGEGVTSISPGERVALMSSHAFSEYDVAPVDQVVALPHELDDQPFPGEPLACAYNIFEAAAIRPGETVAIIGIGFQGAVLTALAARRGARVLALSRRPFALEMARHYGADETLQMDDHWRLLDAVKDLTGGANCDCVIEATGVQWPLDLAAQICRVEGRLVIAGYHQDGARQVNMQLWNWHALRIVNAHFRDPKRVIEGMKQAAGAVASGAFDPAPLYTHRVSLDDLGRGLALLEERPEGFLKGLLIHD